MVQDDELGSGRSGSSLHHSFVRSFASSWSTTRDCAVITAACGRKHVGTRGRGGSSAPLCVSAGARVHTCVGVASCVRNVPWESIPPRKGKEKEGRRTKNDTKAIHPARAAAPSINPFFRVFPPTRPRGHRFTTLRKSLFFDYEFRRSAAHPAASTCEDSSFSGNFNCVTGVVVEIT